MMAQNLPQTDLQNEQNHMDYPYIKLSYNPYQNDYIERFNRTYRTEVLDSYLFKNRRQIRKITKECLERYNTERSYEALNNMTQLNI